MRGTPGLIREELLREPDTTDVPHLRGVGDRAGLHQLGRRSVAPGPDGPLVRWLRSTSIGGLFEIRYRPPESDDRSSCPPIAAACRSAAPAPQPAPRPAPQPAPRPAPQPVPSAPVRTSRRPRSGARGGIRHRSRCSRGETDVLVVGAGPAGLTRASSWPGAASLSGSSTSGAEPAIAGRQGDRHPLPHHGDLGGPGHRQRGDGRRHLAARPDRVRQRPADPPGRLAGLPELPYAHLGLPQYETERILTDRLRRLGRAGRARRRAAAVRQDDDGVTADLRHADGSTETVRAQYLVGCDGAHSAVRSGLGLDLRGRPVACSRSCSCSATSTWTGRCRRATCCASSGSRTTGTSPGCWSASRSRGTADTGWRPWPRSGCSRRSASGVVPAGFWQEYTPPTLADIQAVDRRAGTGRHHGEQPALVVDLPDQARHRRPLPRRPGVRRRRRRAPAPAGRRAGHEHRHPGRLEPGLEAGPGGPRARRADLLDSYEAERRPAGKAIVDRAVAIAFTDEMDMEDEKAQFLLEMQMTMNYAGSPLVGEAADGQVSTAVRSRGTVPPTSRACAVRGRSPGPAVRPDPRHAFTLLLHADGRWTRTGRGFREACRRGGEQSRAPLRTYLRDRAPGRTSTRQPRSAGVPGHRRQFPRKAYAAADSGPTSSARTGTWDSGAHRSPKPPFRNTWRESSPADRSRRGRRFSR